MAKERGLSLTGPDGLLFGARSRERNSFFTAIRPISSND
jgi:hypothetical protein